MSHESYEQKKESIQGNTFFPLGYSSASPQLVNQPPEYHEYEYYKAIMGYGTSLSESVTKPTEPRVQYSYVNNTEQETNWHRIEESSIITSDKSTKSSECKLYVGGTEAEGSHPKVRGSSLLTSVEAPDLASVERRETRNPKSVSKRLLVESVFPFTEHQLFKFFNLIPGLESCEMFRGFCRNPCVVVQYNNIVSAIYAKHKLHGFEYPFGNRLHVTFMEEGGDKTKPTQQTTKQMPSMTLNNSSPSFQPRESSEKNQMPSMILNNSSPSFQPLGSSETKQIPSMILNNSSPSFQPLGSSESQSYSPCIQTNADLPPIKKKAPSDSSVHLFISFDPHPLPQDILDNVLSRFGDFIKVELSPGEDMACATFSETVSAVEAIAVLNRKTVNGVKLSVKLADLPTEYYNKHQSKF